VKRGEVLDIAMPIAESLESIRVGEGGTLLVLPGARLRTERIVVEEGGSIALLGGAIEIARGSWVQSEPLEVGCFDQVTIRLSGGAWLDVPRLDICEGGAIEGQGVIAGSIVSKGRIEVWGQGLDILGDLRTAGPGRLEVWASGSLGPDGSESMWPSIRVAGQVVLQGRCEVFGSDCFDLLAGHPMASSILGWIEARDLVAETSLVK
jgi:hypothetical protein